MEYKLSDLFDLQMGKTPDRHTPEYWTDGTEQWISISDLSKCDKYIEETAEAISEQAINDSGIKIIPASTVIMSFKLSIGKVAITPKPMYSNEAIMAFIDKGVIPIEPAYLYFLLKAKDWDEGTNKAVMGKTLNKATLSQVKVHIHDMAEQRKIIRALEKAESMVTTRRQQLTALDTLIKARFVEMFGSIHDSDKFPYIPVKKLTNVVSGGTPSRDVSEYWDNGDIPWVKTTELQNSVIESVDEYITEKGKNNSAAKIVPVGTVLVAMYGQGKTRGMTGYLGIEATTNQACACILPSNHINMMYLWKYFELSYDKLRSLAQGGGQPNLNVNIIKSFHVLVPPREMQDSFVLFVHQVNKSKAVVQKALDEAQTLFDSLMQQYFG